MMQKFTFQFQVFKNSPFLIQFSSKFRFFDAFYIENDGILIILGLKRMKFLSFDLGRFIFTSLFFSFKKLGLNFHKLCFTCISKHFLPTTLVLHCYGCDLSLFSHYSLPKLMKIRSLLALALILLSLGHI